MIEPRKNAGCLEVPLYAHQVKPAQELPFTGLAGSEDTGLLCQLVVTQCPVLDQLARPADIAIAQQRRQVVGHGSDHGVLVIEYAGVVVIGNHEVARMVIAVHAHSGLLERVIRQ
jgi:hypothetical protein